MRGLLTCIVLCAASACQAASGAEESLGRLFFSPAERQAMARGGEQPSPIVIGPDETQINGYVARHGQRSTVWLNGRPLGVGQSQAGLSVGAVLPAQREVELSGADGRRFRLKPEQGSTASRAISQGGSGR